MSQRYGFVCLLFFLMRCPVSFAQSVPTLRCATPELTKEQIRQLDKAAQFALTIKQTNGFGPSVTYVPVRPHIFRDQQGGGGMSLAKLNRVLAATNQYFLANGSGIQFYFAGSVPDYIDNDQHFAQFVPDNEDEIVSGRDVDNALNLYMVNAFSEANLGGYAYFPFNMTLATRLFILNENNEEDLGNRLLPHELGHTFNLFHTFQGSTGANPELVTRGEGANCTSTGDLVCDTPADPYERAGASVNYVNGCPKYNGTATDPQGRTYSPSITNIMSYYFPCTHDFTPGQYERMAAGLALRQSHTAYTLDYAPGSVTAPTALVAGLAASGKAVILSWQDQATNEMGFFVERAGADGRFGVVGGVGPDQTTFTDATVPPNGTYQYRVRPSNTTTGSFSPSVSVTMPVCRPTYSASCSGTNGLARVAVKGVVLSEGSGCSGAGYSKTTSNVLVGAGQTIPLSATYLNASTALYAAVWVDLNRDGVFDTTERLAAQATAAVGPLDLSITLPLSLSAGDVPLRILTATSQPTDPCGSYGGGETEDYVLQVCTLPTATLTGSQTITAGGIATLTASLMERGPWSLTLSDGTTLTNQTNSPVAFTVSPAVSVSYVVSRLSNGCGVGSSNGMAAVTVLPPPIVPADLSLALLANKRVAGVGNEVVFTMLVTNSGPASASGIVATCLLPPNLTFAGSTQTAVTASAGSVSVAVGTLLPNETGTFAFRIRVEQAGLYRLAAQIADASPTDSDSFLNSGTSDGDDDMAVVDLRTVESGPVFVSPNPNPRPLPTVQPNQPPPPSDEADLSLDVWAGQRIVVSGGAVSLSVVLSNRGALTATNVVVQVNLPEGWTVPNPTGLTVNGSVVTASVAEVAVDGRAIIEVPVQVTGPGDRLVRVRITAATQPDSDSPHDHADGLGEDDEALLSIRVW